MYAYQERDKTWFLAFCVQVAFIDGNPLTSIWIYMHGRSRGKTTLFFLHIDLTAVALSHPLFITLSFLHPLASLISPPQPSPSSPANRLLSVHLDGCRADIQSHVVSSGPAAFSGFPASALGLGALAAPATGGSFPMAGGRFIPALQWPTAMFSMLGSGSVWPRKILADSGSVRTRL